MGNVFNNVFDRVYIMMKLSMMFWMMTFMGGIILGIGPALMAVTELFVEFEWEHAEMKFSELPLRFKDNFVQGNLVFYSMLAFFGFASYNLFLAVQMKGFFFMFIQFLLIISLTLIYLMFIYAIMIHAHFDVGYKNLMKLSFISVFANMSKILKLFFTTIMIGFVTYQFKGFILFITTGLFVIMMVKATDSWMLILEEQIEV